MIYLFIPAFNEEESLPKLLPKIRNVLEEHQMEYRLLVVNDGSRDRTQEILEEFVASGMPLEVLRHPINRGLGETERDGFEFVAQHTEPDDIIV
ncbi:MAG: glycosyltransferase, partial [Bacteroidota bacterium]